MGQPIDPELRQSIATRLIAGQSHVRIASDLQTHSTTVQRVARDLDLPANRRKMLPDSKRAEIARALRMGRSASEISRALHTTRKTVAKVERELSEAAE